MPVTYERAKPEITELLLKMRNKHHPGLCKPEVTVDILMTQEIEPETGEVLPTLKHNKYPAVAVIKETSLKERALGLADALLIIDAVRWDELGDKEREATLDHELQHLEVQVDAESEEPKLDDLQRPKLKLRLHDWELGGFTAVAQRHGKHAIEVKAVRACVDGEGQYFWDWDRPRKVA